MEKNVRQLQIMLFEINVELFVVKAFLPFTVQITR